MKILYAFLLLLSALPVAAQSYDSAFGVRLGTDWGLTFKQRLAKKTTAELIAQSSLQREEVLLTLLGEQHMPFLTRRLNLYAGGGLHKGWGWEAADVEGSPYRNPFGLTFIGGIELSLGRLNLSWDFKPAVNLVGGARTFYSQTGISLRYVVVKRKWLKRGNRAGQGGWRFWENW
ncbi:hypothetical protein [Phaeodactylibacter luteus]|uniref:Outer membrane protein beta-barrel domain-containing protein n=1 Tax=Phaeodactylibacter luteus TaxID=1564516 RepID=A0A5C6RL56_9BACT|nr:hypothetical protein [Phaeodactylibacter luteus]TXB62350.1 hypothetical protein FRY97_14410 [Phaeodactylibacter luteus]